MILLMNIPTIFLCLSLLTVLLTIKIGSQWPDEKVHVIGCNVGQGDATLISKGFSQIIVDTGPNESATSCLQRHLPFWDRRLSLVIISHFDKDHVGGLKSLADHYTIGNLVYYPTESIPTEWREFIEELRQSGTYVVESSTIQQMKVTGVQLDFLWPIEEGLLTQANQILGVDEHYPEVSARTLSDNETSIVVRVTYGTFALLLTGDITAHVEKQLLMRNKRHLLPSTVLKIAHHGSRFSTTQQFLTEVKPLLALLSVGKNSYGHPNQQVLDLLSQNQIVIHRTDQAGDLVVVTDGSTWEKRK